MSKYSAEEVRARFEVWYNHLTQHPYAMAYNNPLGLPVEGDMKGGMWLGYKAAFAERIEADERMVTYDIARKVYAAIETEGDAIECMHKALLSVWPNPPAQAGQSAASGDCVLVPCRISEMQADLIGMPVSMYEKAIKTAAMIVDSKPYGESPAQVAQGESIPAELFAWLTGRNLVPDLDEDGSFDLSMLIEALNEHENQLLAAHTRAVPDGCMVVPLLKPNEMQALRRFAETAEDDESYDVPKDMMAFLSIHGAVTRSATKKDWFWLTDYGRMLLSAAPSPGDPS